MTDFFEIDFLDVETKKSGDAIAIRYSVSGQTLIHVVDGGYIENGQMVIDHIRGFYNSSRVDHVVSTHPDHDHTGGLRKVLETMEVGTLWMNRPWLYADVLIHRFSRLTNVDNLVRSLKKAYPNTAALEEIAKRKGIVIREVFQGNKIGAFTVMSPEKSRYLDKIVESEKTGKVAEILDEGVMTANKISRILSDAISRVVNYVRASWGDETFPNSGTSAENEMSVVQYTNICDKKILLTADAGVEGLQDFVKYAPQVGLYLPGIDHFQVPHHGSRRNITSELLDDILGSRLSYPSEPRFLAIISSAKADADHPRKSVVRAMHHRGAKVITTENGVVSVGYNSPARFGWGAVPGVPYPDEQES